MVEQKTTGENGKDYLVQRQQNPASLDLVPVLKSSIIRNNGHYSIEREEARRILSGESEIIPGSEVLYLSRGNLEEMLSQAKYSPMDLKSYDKERHINIPDAYQLIEFQEDSNLSPEKLRQAIKSGDIKVYQFKEQK